MPAFVALLRGVNVGGGNRVPMAALRTLLEDLGYTKVATLLNSGNAVFTAPSGSTAAHATRIAGALDATLGVRVPVIVKSAKELAAIVEGNPLPLGAVSPSKFLVVFTQRVQELGALRDLVEPVIAPPEGFALGAHAGYLACPNGISQSQGALALLGKGGRSATTRNLATTLKLLALAQR